MSEFLDKLKLNAELADAGFIGDFYFFDEVDSTNIRAVEMLNDGIAAPFAVTAFRQTSGRGRLKRKWYSDTSTLCMTVAVPLPSDQKIARSFTLRCGLEICERLCSVFSARMFLKWPNDIYTEDGRKIAGMLSELHISKSGARTVAFGIGVNCFLPQNISEIPQDIFSAMGNLSDVSNADISMNKTAAIVASTIADVAVEDANKSEEIVERFAKYDWLFGRKIALDAGSKIYEGVASGIDDSGNLKLKLERGEILSIPALEATVIKK